MMGSSIFFFNLSNSIEAASMIAWTNEMRFYLVASKTNSCKKISSTKLFKNHAVLLMEDFKMS